MSGACTNKPTEKVSSTTKFRKKPHYHPIVEFCVHQKIQVSFQFSKRFVLTFQRRCSSLQVLSLRLDPFLPLPPFSTLSRSLNMGSFSEPPPQISVHHIFQKFHLGQEIMSLFRPPVLARESERDKILILTPHAPAPKILPIEMNGFQKLSFSKIRERHHTKDEAFIFSLSPDKLNSSRKHISL